MNITENDAMKLWENCFGNAEFAQDCFGTWMCKKGWGNNPSVCIAIDEFDAGVFEHLLGTIVKVYAESGKGLFIFTSHNLRPLEILRRNNIFFTTKEHYLFDTSKYIPKDFNRRNNYLRAMSLDNDEFFQVNQAKGYELRSALGGYKDGIAK